MWTRRRQTGQVKAPESLGSHVELDKGWQDGVVLDVHVARGGHGDQGLDPGQRNEASSWLLIGGSLGVKRLDLSDTVKFE